MMSIVAEKTGYPGEMLEPGMALDADLGIDSIKRVEILSALQERLPEMPAVKPEDLGRLQTLQQLVSLQLGQAAIDPEDRLYEDLGAESMDLVNLAVAIEDRFQVFIPEEDLADLRTVHDLYNLVLRHLNVSS